MPAPRRWQAGGLHDIGEHTKPAATRAWVVGEAGSDAVRRLPLGAVLITVPADPDGERVEPVEHRMAAARAACAGAQACDRRIVMGIPQGEDPRRPDPHLEDPVLIPPPALIRVARRVAVAPATRPGSRAFRTHWYLLSALPRAARLRRVCHIHRLSVKYTEYTAGRSARNVCFLARAGIRDFP